MSFSPELAEIRFGCGLSPKVAGPQRREDMLAALSGPDVMAQAYPIEDFETFNARIKMSGEIRQDMKKVRGTPRFNELRKQRNLLNKEAREDMAGWYTQTLLRWSETPEGFRERLARFWGDHFTATGKRGVARRATSPYIEAAIRPLVSGRFADLLISAVTHPVMLIYLDQMQSVGPGSKRGLASKGRRGLNENLAREVLELHTLGVDGRYGQEDVRQLAELFTGMTYQPKSGFKFVKDWAEPGAETILGKRYGGDPGKLRPIKQALRDLAVHPDTAHHIAWKLAVHFVSDSPDPGLIAAMEARFLSSDGDLMQVYDALLSHPASWEMPLSNVKPPFDFIASSCRALAVAPKKLHKLKENQIKGQLLNPMTMMGQIWQKAPGPDGWAEEDAVWITPQSVSARLRWAMTIPQVLRPKLPDPRTFVSQALGPVANDVVRFAATSAESRSDAIGLVLSSPSFQRR